MNMLHFRHATKAFDSTKTIEKDDINYILEAGRLSPSSFGIEPWEFLVMGSKDMKNELQKACFNQVQVSSASMVIVVLARKDLRLEDGYVESLLSAQGEEYYENTLKDMYSGYVNTLSDEQLLEYSDKQCYLASMNLMNAGAILGIDSCPMGGFESDKIMKLLEIDCLTYEVSMVIPFGYKSATISPKLRRDFDEVVKFIDEF